MRPTGGKDRQRYVALAILVAGFLRLYCVQLGAVMRVIRTTSNIVAIIAIILPAANAQWLKTPTPGIPRTTDGKPNLTAPAPKTPDGKPDLSGIWQSEPGGYDLNIVSDLKPAEIQPWAEELYRHRMENFSKDHPGLRCLPGIGPQITFGMYKILQTPSAIAFITGSEARQVLTDGRGLPEDPNPTWQGYSVGHWEGDTLVIQSAGFNDRTWLDFGGHPHTEALRVTERFHRKDFGHMDLTMTFEDPKAYARPWTITMDTQLVPDTEILEYVCNENERDLPHIIVTEEDRKKSRTKVTVAPEILAKYAGSYELVDKDGKPQDRNGKRRKDDAMPDLFVVAVDGDQLILQIPGSAGKLALSAESDTTFSIAGQPVEFTTDAHGVATHFVIAAVEGDQKAVRRK